MDTPHVRRWPASLAVLVVLGAYFVLPDSVSLGPTWLLPAVQAALLLPLVLTNPLRLRRDQPALRALGLVSASAVGALNLATLVHLVVRLLGGSDVSAPNLVVAALVILVTNVVAAAVLLWDLDAGGPFARSDSHTRPSGPPDVQFPQTTMDPTWRPSFVDYLFTGFTISTAFSPTDAMPLTGRTKTVFMVGSTTAVATIALVAARAVNAI